MRKKEVEKQWISLSHFANSHPVFLLFLPYLLLSIAFMGIPGMNKR
jgi:hypothetical protein